MMSHLDSCINQLPAHQGKDCLTDEFLFARMQDLQIRLKNKRFEHTMGVAHTALELARTYGVDERKAYAAGLLHDWDKNYSDEEIRQRSFDLGISVEPYVYEHMPLLLHGPTASVALSRSFEEFPADVARAIKYHTTGDKEMTDLDMVVYVADVIEPSREYGQIDYLRGLVGHESLEVLFCATFQQVLINLVERQKLVYPHTLEVWNHYVSRARSRRYHETGKEKRD